jgi:hypothetical protein
MKQPYPDTVLCLPSGRLVLCEIKAFEDAAPFWSLHEWRHGFKRRYFEAYQHHGRKHGWYLAVYEAANERIGLNISPGETVIYGEGRGSDYVYWLQEHFHWHPLSLNLLGRTLRPYNSLTDQPTKEVADRPTGQKRRFEEALAFGLEAEEQIVKWFRDRGCGCWRLDQRFLQGE